MTTKAANSAARTEMGGLTMDIAALAEIRHETSGRHGSFEAIVPPHDWWDWHAAYMDARQGGSSPDAASAAAGRYKPRSSMSSSRLVGQRSGTANVVWSHMCSP